MNESSVRNNRATISSGAMTGKVIKRNLNHSDARSTLAASYSVAGTDDRPASAMSITKGDHIQVSAMTTDQSA